MQVKPSSRLQPVPFSKTLFLTSCLPLLFGLLCEGILYILTDQSDALFMSDQNEYQNPQGNRFLLSIRQAKDVSYGTYRSFTQFMVTMLIIHLLGLLIQRLKLKMADDGLLLLSNGDKKSSDEASKSKKINSIMLSFFGYAFAYFAIYYIRSIVGTQIEEANSLQTLQHLRFQEEGDFSQESPSRMLEEISNDHQPIKAIPAEPKKNLTTFPLGRVLGSLNIEASSVVFSKDETVLFVGRTSFFGITAVDITNWENPRVIKSYQGGIQKENFKHVSLLLSPDGKSLFASNMLNFAQFQLDDSNEMPNYQFRYIQEFATDVNATVRASLALSSDGTKVFVSGYGLQVFDASKSHFNELIKSQLPAKEFNLSSVGISGDGKSLFLINGTRLDIYNITDINNTNLILSMPTDNTPCSFLQSKDKRILMVIGFQKGTKKIVIERVDVSDVTAPAVIKTFPLNIESFSSLFELSQSPKETYLYFTVKTLGEKKMMVFDLLNERLLEDSQNMISKARSLQFTSNEKSLIVMFEEYIATFQLYRSFPNDRFFTLTKNSLAQISSTPKGSNQILELFSNILLSVDQMGDSAGSRFTFTDISNRSSPVEINSFSAGNDPISVSVTKETLFASFKKEMVIYDISDLKSINILGSYALDERDEFLDAVFTSDGKTCYAIIANDFKGSANFGSFDLKIFDLSDPTYIRKTDSYFDLLFWRKSPNLFLILSKDEKSLFLAGNYLYTFDVSARTLKKLFNRVIDGLELIPSSASLSPDQKILIIRKEDPISSSLNLIDVRNPENPTEFSSIALPKTKTTKNIPVTFSPDSKLIYAEGTYDGKPSLLIFDISNPSSPRYQNAFSIEGFTQGSVDNFVISKDGLSIYLASDLENKIMVVDLVIPHTVFLGAENFPLGEKSTTDVMVLGQKSQGDYIPLTLLLRHIRPKKNLSQISIFFSLVNLGISPKAF